jgi:CHAT domain-containing protein/tetratricopeptide (TPR) repeat protein
LLAEANRLSWLGNWDAAGPLYARSEELLRVSGDAPGEIYARVGRVRAEAAAASLTKALQILEHELKNPIVQADPKLRLWCLTAKASVDFDFDSAAAKRDWLAALGLANSIGEKQWASRATGELGTIAFLEGDTSAAVSRVGKAVLSAYATGDVAAQVEFLSLAGVGFNEERRFSEALSFFHRAIRLAEKTPDAGFPYMAHEGEVTALLGLERAEQAREALANVFATAQAHNRKSEEALILILFGDASLAAHDTEQAKEYFKRAAQQFQEVRVHRGLDEAMFKLAGLYRQQGDLERASRSLRLGMEAGRRVGGRYYLPRALTALAELEVAQKKFRQADQRFQEAEEVMEGIVAGLQSDNEAAAVAGSMSETYVEHFRLLVRRRKGARAFQVLERVRGRRAANVFRTQNAPAKQSPVLSLLNRAIGSVQLSLLRSEDPAKRPPLLDELHLYERGLAFAMNEARRERHAQAAKPVSLSAIRAALSRNEALVAYILDEPQSFCIAITREAAQIIGLPTGQKQIENLVLAFLGEIRARGSGGHYATELYALLLGSLPAPFRRPRLIISPDGILHLVPFEALRDPHGDFLVRSTVVSYTPSATVLRNLRARGQARAARPLLAVGAVDYKLMRVLTSRVGAGSLGSAILGGLAGLSGSHLEDLPTSREEVLSISRFAGNKAELLLGERATETAFKAQPLRDFGVIHMAVHAVADPQYPDRAALVLGADSETPDDGLLQVREIMRLPLHAELVTLSACETEIGAVEGEAGMLGLSQAFLMGGARTVVASLWNVEDHSTTALMKDFYTHLARHEDKAVALANAKRDLLRRYGNVSPYYWAGFVMLGEGSGRVSFGQ